MVSKARFLSKITVAILSLVIVGTILPRRAEAQTAMYQSVPAESSAGKQTVKHQANPPTNHQTLAKWFLAYDNIRRQAQMNPQEKQRADTLLSQGLSIVIPGQEKADSQALLSSLVNRYQVAAEAIKQLQYYPETGDLHKGYYQYFSDASQLFSDYLKVQDNLFAVDDQTGKPLASQLMDRKEKLEQLERRNKYLDTQLRNQLGMAPYQY
jgi:hypothetical protein